STGPAAERDVQRRRARRSAVITGVGTVEQDNPSLTIREAELDLANAAEVAQRQPLRVVLDRGLRIDPAAKLLDLPGNTLLVCGVEGRSLRAAVERDRVQVMELPERDGQLDLDQLLAELAKLE